MQSQPIPSLKAFKQEALELLMQLIATPSFSGEEEQAAAILEQFFHHHDIPVHRAGNNVWVRSEPFEPERPTLLLNSHIDTVQPGAGWSRSPFEPVLEEGKLYGLGSNDAGGCLVSLAVTFLHYYKLKSPLHFNIIFAATAEEESSGPGGIERVLPELGPVDVAIVGEPTGMAMAVAEKGLVVLDCVARGRTGHAARDTGINAIEIALQDIQWLRTYRFPRRSELLGPVRMTVTMIQAGIQHNIIPDLCTFTVDVRTTDAYSNEEVVDTIRRHLRSEVTPRSLRLQPSKIDLNHPLVQAAKAMGLRLFGSPTTSDQALIPAPSVKIGPGRSERSHTPDEFIYVDELEQGIEGYIQLLDQFNENMRAS